ncbi:MAG: hypothetical protein LUF04_14100 [Bacteroides sp.]|nr:hypothetical protein [Bacteroides sp.]
MARTINEIQNEIIEQLQERTGVTYSPSKVAEWRIWTYIVAAAIHAFEIMVDLFRAEIDTITDKVTTGTARWYAEMCYRFQSQGTLIFDESTATLYYDEVIPEAQIIKVVAIKENGYKLVIKAAKRDGDGYIVPLSLEEKEKFIIYINSIKFVGVDTNIISETEDKVWYDMDVYYDPSIPPSAVHRNVLIALDNFKTSLGFDSMIYKQRMADAVMQVPGVVTCNILSLEREWGDKNAGEGSGYEHTVIDVYDELHSGYFEYDEEQCHITMISIKDVEL